MDESDRRQRAVQLTYVNRAGLGDRRSLFSWLLALGKLLDARTYTAFGREGPRFYLSQAHSKHISKTWSNYFDTTTYDGHPFRDPVANDCVVVRDAASFCTLVDNYLEEKDRVGISSPAMSAWRCLNISFNPWLLALCNCSHLAIDVMGVQRNIAQTYINRYFRLPPRIPPSHKIVQLADSAVRRHNVSMYGVMHVRRADRGHRECTRPSVIAGEMRQRAAAVDGWIIYTYTELKLNASSGKEPTAPSEDEVYLPSLRRMLVRLGKPLIFESEFLPIELVHHDNYLAYGVGAYLMQIADLRGACIDTRFCGVGCARI
eukprot:scaffold13152_cov135-Isochrysis_galbana.AAC.2